MISSTSRNMITLIKLEELALVAPYGELGWLRNARSSGKVTLTRKRRSETLGIIPVGA